MKKFFSIVCVLVFTIFAFVGCGKSFTSMADVPAIGNGGLAVAKGEYIYYVNGFASKNDNLNKNKEGKITTSGIYRVKAKDVSYNVVDGKLYFTSGAINTDENGNIVGSELIVSKVCGFENAGIYIFGDYIYFTSPNNQTAKDGTVYVNDVDFCRARLDGEKFKILGTVSVGSEYYSNLQTSFYSLNGNVYFSAFNGNNNLSVFEITSKKATQIYSKASVTQVLLPEITQNFVGAKQKALETKIFFIENSKLLSFDISTKLSKELTNFSSSEQFSFIGNSGNNIYYSIEKNGIKTIYCNSCPSHFSDGQKAIISTSDNTYTGFEILSERDNLIAVTSSEIIIYDIYGNAVKNLSASGAEIVGVCDDNIFYIASSNLYTVNLFAQNTVTVVLESEVSLSSDILNNISFSNQNVFFYKTLEDGSRYVQMINYKQLDGSSIITKQLLKA